MFKAGLSAVPVVGGSFSSLITDYIPNRKMERIGFYQDGSVEKLLDRLTPLGKSLIEFLTHERVKG